MNRRGFLASLLGLAVAPIVGDLPAKPPLDLMGWSPLIRRGDAWRSAKAWNDAGLAPSGATKYWYDKAARTIRVRHYSLQEIYKAPGTSS